MNRLMIGRYMDLARLLPCGAPAPSLVVAQLEVLASTGSQSQIVIPKTIAPFQAQSICNSLMDRLMMVDTLMLFDFFYVERQHQL
jgi:hypothetical protein